MKTTLIIYLIWKKIINIVTGIRKHKILKKLIWKNEYKVYAEIGVFKGETTRHILSNCLLDNIICVDDYTNNNGRNTPEEMKEIKQSTKDLRNNFKIDFYLLKSEEAVKKIEDNSIDIIFIDADHNEVNKDIELWYPKVKKGGIISGHDFNLNWLNTSIAIKKRFPKVNVSFDSLWWVRK